MKRLAIITEIIAPYRIPVFNALAARGDVDLHVIFLAETDPELRQWQVYRNEIRFSYEVLPAWRRRLGKLNLLMNWGTGKALDKFSPDSVMCGGYNYPACWSAARWCNRHGVPLLLWSESTADDSRSRKWWVGRLKKRFMENSTAFVAAGKSSREYLESLGAKAERIFIAPDAVDVELYARIAQETRSDGAGIRVRFDLPQRFLLCAGRLVREKGVFELLEAYARLDDAERSQIGLVFAGEGGARAQLETRAAEIWPGSVRFTGFVQRDQLAELYGTAEALVFPTHSDPWGLVVNEAMACGLPIVASSVAGCVRDLVLDGRNGFVVRAGDVEEITGAIRRMLQNPEMVRAMGAESRAIIRGFTPEACAGGMSRAVEFVCGATAQLTAA